VADQRMKRVKLLRWWTVANKDGLVVISSRHTRAQAKRLMCPEYHERLVRLELREITPIKRPRRVR
jgi:hypothetical protein